jgi:hypothetical protein
MKSMLLISSILHDIQLLPFFLRHYRSRGVTRFVFHVWRGRENALWPKILDETAGFDTELLTGDAGVFNGEADAVLCDAARQRFVAGDQWYVVADLDEFHVVPGDVTFDQAVHGAEAEDCEAIGGTLVDRVTIDGTLPSVVDRRYALGPQFPWACDITERILLGCTAKVQLAKGNVAIRPGHHDAGGRPTWGRLGEVHHFKWTQSTMEEQERRVTSYRDQGLCYQPESERLLSYLADNEGRLPVHDPVLNTRLVAPDPLRRTCAVEACGTG